MKKNSEVKINVFNFFLLIILFFNSYAFGDSIREYFFLENSYHIFFFPVFIVSFVICFFIGKDVSSFLGIRKEKNFSSKIIKRQEEKIFLQKIQKDLSSVDRLFTYDGRLGGKTHNF